ncbi:signal peptidase I [Catellatospora sp. TT07R-123]|uniref:signal peptidase I n=1 Tax=Catellatospora sp. TT07R-123 TaxID=2733863 RepID=UPI001FD62434|nr:signal peptidase I [Catellatospora sp. TT07R-123]
MPSGRAAKDEFTGEEWPKRRRRGRRKGMPLWQELPLLLVVAFCLAVLIRTFLMQAFYIPSGSMEDTLLVGDRVLVNKVVYDFRDPERGEVIVFRGPDNWAPENRTDPDAGFFSKLGRTVGDLVGISQPGEKDFIKRVIGVPGDRVSCCSVEGWIYVNGVPVEEPYVIRNSPIDSGNDAKSCISRKFPEVTVEPGMLFVMGDHRLVSQDSRCQGQVPIDDVIGKAMVVALPFDRWGSVAHQEVFDKVPAPGANAIGAPGTQPASGLAVVAPLLLSLAALRRGRIGRPSHE